MKKTNKIKTLETNKDLLSSKAGQEQKSKILVVNPKRGQEEMVGFALILIIVAIIFIVVISIYIRKTQEPIEDSEAKSFIQSVLQYTTTCEESNLENLSVQELIFQCQEKDPCEYGNYGGDSCRILNETLKNLIKESWEVNQNTAIKGYFFAVNISDGIDEEQLIVMTKGVVTNNYRGSLQDFAKSGTYVKIFLKIYS